METKPDAGLGYICLPFGENEELGVVFPNTSINSKWDADGLGALIMEKAS
jgi:hypothetical protein